MEVWEMKVKNDIQWFRVFLFLDYKKIATIPAGSRNIHIEELAPSENTIAISDKSEKKFYLNGKQ